MKLAVSAPMRMRWLVILFFSLLVGPLVMAQPTLCTVTINSSNEKDIFSKNLVPQGFRVVELTDFADSDQQTGKARLGAWFDKACVAQIQCDILLISGHFGGNFFSTDPNRSFLELPTPVLLEHACKNDCEGILSHPKEVFLFGCNTLAGKTPDSRTPEEYIRVLVDDGIPLESALRVAAARYSPVGGSFGNSMQKIFMGVPQIYGFKSKGPTGAQIESHLKKYFQLETNASQLMSRLEQEKETPADQWLRTRPPLAQNWMTALVGKPSAFTWGLERSHLRECQLMDAKTDRLEKLSTVRDLLRLDSRWDYLLEIESFLKNQKVESFTAAEKKVWLEIADDTSIRHEFELILPNLNSMLLLKNSLMQISLRLGWLSPVEYKEEIYRSLSFLFSRQMTLPEADQICSINLETFEPAPSWLKIHKGMNIKALACLKPVANIGQIFLEAMQSGDSETQNAATAAIMMTKSDDQVMQMGLAEMVARGEGLGPQLATIALSQVKVSNEQVLMKMAEGLQSPRAETRHAVAYAFMTIAPQSVPVQKKLAEALKDPEKMVRAEAAYALTRILATDKDVQLRLIEALGDPETEEYAEKALRKVSITDATVRAALLKLRPYW